MMNFLAYAGCIHRLQINENGYVQIDIFGYDSTIERFVNVIEKPLIPSMTMKSNKCTVAGSCWNDRSLFILLHLTTSNNSILMFLELPSRPWSCHIVYTLSVPSYISHSIRFLSTNLLISIFTDEGTSQNGFYLIDNDKQKCQRTIKLIQCSLLTYIYCYLHDNYYWVMGTDLDLNKERKSIKVKFVFFVFYL